MRIYQHENYESYVEGQRWKNVKKLTNVWIKQAEIDMISKHILHTNPNPTFGICHGIRNAWEVQAFRKTLGCEVIGTDIIETVNQFDNTIQWDFHEINPDWTNKADFIYTNSADHAYDLDKALSAWKDSLKPTGKIYLHHGDYYKNKLEADRADCLIVSTDEMRKLCNAENEFFALHDKRTIFVIGASK